MAVNVQAGRPRKAVLRRKRVSHSLLTIISLLLVNTAQAAPENDPVQNAIKRAAKYLQSIHRPVQGYSGGSNGMGTATLAGLALLESGIPENDPSVQAITRYVRDNALAQTRTYEVALTIMFLDRLGQPADRPIIQMLGLRLIGGQNRQGGWEYDCGYAINPQDIARLRTMFNKEATLVLGGPKPEAPKKEQPKDQPKTLPRTDLPIDPAVPMPKSQSSPTAKQPVPKAVKKEAANPPQPDENKTALHPEVARWAKLVNLPTTDDGDFRRNQGGDDNSNTQFAALGVWCARKHGVPTDKALALLALRFRSSQSADGGWGYKYQYGGGGTTPSMTCAGLIGLAISHGSAINVLRNQKDDAKKAMEAGEDVAIKKGLKCLGNYITQARGMPPEVAAIPAKKGVNRIKSDALNINHYFLWSLERVAVIFGLETIGNHDWYTWGADGLLETQQADGSWRSRDCYPGGNEEISTSFALLFLSRANVARDLATLLNGKVKDPGVAILRGGGDLAKILPERPNPKIDLASTAPMPRDQPASTTSDDFQVEAKRLSNSLVTATAKSRPDILAQLRDNKGSVHTEGLALAIPRLSGEVQQQARDALAQRLTRMTAKTLREFLKDENREVRRGAAIACGCKEDKQFTGDLIDLLADADALVAIAARDSLRTLSGKDFGPNSTSILDKENSILAWKNWWKTQKK